MTGKHSVDLLQQTTTLGTSYIIREVLQSETWSVSGGDHRWFERSTREKRFLIRDNSSSNNNNNNALSVVLSKNHVGSLGPRSVPLEYVLWCYAERRICCRDFAKPPFLPLSKNHLYTNLFATQRPTRNVWLNFALLLSMKDSTFEVWAPVSTSRNIRGCWEWQCLPAIIWNNGLCPSSYIWNKKSLKLRFGDRSGPRPEDKNEVNTYRVGPNRYSYSQLLGNWWQIGTISSPVSGVSWKVLLEWTFWEKKEHYARTRKIY